MILKRLALGQYGKGGYVIKDIEEVGMSQGSELDRLERFVGELLERYDQLLDRNAELKKLLQQREDEISELQDRLSAADLERGDISSRIKGLIDQIEEWQTIVLESEEEAVEGEQDETVADYQDSVRYEEEDDREASLQRNLFHVERRNHEGSGE